MYFNTGSVEIKGLYEIACVYGLVCGWVFSINKYHFTIQIQSRIGVKIAFDTRLHCNLFTFL